MQTTDTIMMVRPFLFRMNEETAVNNYFQINDSHSDRISELAVTEFDNFVKLQKDNGIHCVVIQDDGKLDTPDSIFPNNVISFHGKKAILYPMFAENRRRERELNYLGKLGKTGINFEEIKDYSIYEDQKQFLEGTGSIILDRVNKVAYCSISERANEQLLQIYCEDQGYTAVKFHALQEVDGQWLPIYHTNVMMSVGTHFALICLDSIKVKEERLLVEEKLLETGKSIITITEEQMHKFAGNILEVKNIFGEAIICMSTQAYESFTEEQIENLETFGKILHAPLFSIEKYGGGSARCMMAEVFHI